MDDKKLVQKKDSYQTTRAFIPAYTLQTYEQAFEIEYTHNSTAIEGNTLTLIETKVVLEDGLAIGGMDSCGVCESSSIPRWQR